MGGPFSSRLIAVRIDRIIRAQDLSAKPPQLLAILDALGGHHELREVGRGELLVERQIETRCARAHEIDVVIDFRRAC